MAVLSNCRVSVLLAAFLLLCSARESQAQITSVHYDRAESFLSHNVLKDVFHLSVQPIWLPDNTGFFHITQTAQGKRAFLTLIAERSTAEAFDHAALARHLSYLSGIGVAADNLPIDNLRPRNKDVFRVDHAGKTWEYDRAADTLTQVASQPQRDSRGLSPDGKWRALTRDYNLYLQHLETNEEIPLSTLGNKGFEYGSTYGWSDLIEGENGDRPDQFFVRWSPDSKKIYTQIVDLRRGKKMHLLDFTVDTLYRPRLLSYYRASPGDTDVVYYRPVIFDVATRKETPIDIGLLPQPTSTTFRWDDDSRGLNAVYTHRGYKRLDAVQVDASSGNVRIVFSDSTDTSLESPIFRQLDSGEAVFSSPRSGWNHLYLYDWPTGRLIRQLTDGEYMVNQVIHVDEAERIVYFTASGKEPGRNPYYPHLYRISLDGGEADLLTQADAFHEISLSPDRKTFVDNYSTVMQPTRSVLADLRTGEIIHEISSADVSRLSAKGWRPPLPFTAIAKDGKTTLHGIIHRPTDFDSTHVYPVVDYTYTGPHTAVTPKTFRAAVVGLQQPLAEFGIVVVTVDGLGTAGRSKAFRDVSYRNLGDGTTDHVLAIRQLSARHGWIDTTRVGIFGHSAGGYDAARAMLLHPDFYKVGVASAGDHDHRMEKAWWPEMYMGFPYGDFYHEQSNVTNAKNLKGRLLLAHGALDENVNPSATYKLADALIREGKHFDMLILPGKTHDFGRVQGDYFTKRRWDYFIQHLLGQQPLYDHRLKTIERW